MIVPVDANNGRVGKWVSFPAEKFEQGILSMLKEVRAADVQGDTPAGKRVEVLAGRVAETEGLLKLWSAKMDNPATVDIVAAKLAELNTRRKSQSEELADAQREAANPLCESWGEFRSLVEMMREDTSDELRVKVRSALRRSVESIRCLFVLRGPVQVAGAQVRFVGSERTRDYVIWNRMKSDKWGVLGGASDDVTDADTRRELDAIRAELQALSGTVKRTARKPLAPALASEEQGYDFRNPEHVIAVEKALETYAEFFRKTTAKSAE